MKKISLNDIPFVAITLWFLICIFKQHQPIQFDQNFIIQGLHPLQGGWPRFDGGITSNFLANLVGLIFHPTPENINGYTRGLAAFLLLSSTYITLREFVSSVWIRYFGLLILLFSGYPFLWLSSEIFAASFILLFLFSWLKNWPLWVVAIFGLLFAHCKPDLALIGLSLGLVILFQERNSKKRLQFIISSIVVFLILNLPGIILYGFSNHLLTNRSFDSISQHFASLAYVFQLQPAPEPWANSQVYMSRIVPLAHSFGGFISNYPHLYLIYVSTSLGLLIAELLRMCTLLVAPWLMVLFKRNQRNSLDPILKKTFLFATFSMVGLIPIFLITLPHERYLVRFYVLFLIFTCFYLDRKKFQKSWLKPLFCSLIFLTCFYYQGRNTWRALTHLTEYSGYWFRD